MSKLALVKKTKLKEPVRLCVYGVEGLGKTTFAAHAENPIWLDVEGGSSQLSVARYPFRPEDTKRGHVPETLNDIREAIADLATSQHDYQTLVIDTTDALEKLVHKFILARDKPKSKDSTPGINAYGYGKGVDIALDEFRALALELDRLRLDRGMQIVLLAHSTIRKFESPVSEPYDRYTMRMNEKAAAFLREWCDVTAFGCFEETTTDLLGDRVKGVSTGRRLLKFKREATHDAKSRYAIPDVLEMPANDPWGPFAKALSDARDMTAEQLTEAINKECERVGDDILTEKAKGLVVAAGGDTATLQRILEKLRAKEGK